MMRSLLKSPCPFRAWCCCWSCPGWWGVLQHRPGIGQNSLISHHCTICAELKPMTGGGSTFYSSEPSWLPALFSFNFVITSCLLPWLNHHFTHAIYHNLCYREMISHASHRRKKTHKIIYIFQRDQLPCCLIWRSESSWVIVVNTVMFVIRFIGYLKHRENKKKKKYFFF